MFDRFTDRARRVVVLAQEEARLLSHGFIGTEHLLLGLLHEGESVAAQVLESMDVTLPAVREQVEATIGRSAAVPGGSPPFTPRAKKVLELSLRESMQLGHTYIGPEHLLLGIVREGEGVAAQVLASMGVELLRVRQQVIQHLAAQPGRPGGATTPLDPTARRGPWPRQAVAPAARRCSVCGRDLWEAAHYVAAGEISICDDCVRASARLLDEAGPEERRLALPPRVFGPVPDEQAVAAVTLTVQTAFAAATAPAARAAVVEAFDEVEDAFGRHTSRLATEPTGTWLHRIRFLTPTLAEVLIEVTGADGTTVTAQGRVSRDGDDWKVTTELATRVLVPARPHLRPRPGEQPPATGA